MGIQLVSSALKSRGVRSSLGNNGIRRIGRQANGSGFFGSITGFFGNLFDKLVAFQGWFATNIAGSINFSFTDAWGLIVQTTSFIYNFNWQASDEQLDQKAQALQNALAGQLGDLVGTTLGQIICGIVPSAGIAYVNPLMGAYLLQYVGEEAFDEIASELVSFLRSTFRAASQTYIINKYKNTRKAIKEFNKNLDPDSWQRQVLDSAFGGNSDNLIKTWGDEDRKPWSFRIWVEDSIESIKNPQLQNFVEDAYDSFLDSCVEAGYTVAEGLDSWVLQQQMTADRVNGEQRIVRVQPDREAEDEDFILAGGENNIRSQLPMVMANHQMVENRDIGQWVGETIRDSTSVSPSELTVRLVLYSRKTPPYSKAKQSATITLHDFKKSKLDWNTIKQALGGNNGYSYGRFRATAKLDSGRQLVVYASSENEAEKRILELEQLIDPEIQALNITEEKKSGARANGKPLQKKPIKIYPAFMYIQAKQRILNEGTDQQGFQTLDGTWNSRRFTIELFPDTKPDDFEQVVASAIKTPGAS